MFGKLFAVCALGIMALGMSAQQADSMIALPKTLKLPPHSALMTHGGTTLAPFAHVRFCAAMPAECKAKGKRSRVVLSGHRWKQLKRVNAIVNRAIRPVNDRKVRAIADHWTLAPRAGDCEDYALTKRSQLIRKGWPSGSLLIATAHAPGVGGHAVLIVRTNRGDFVLDNLTQSIRPWNKTGYHWRKMQSPKNPRYWVKI